MEAVPRLHMLYFTLKSSPEGTSFANLKKYIAEVYQEDAETYTKEVFALETLRNQAMHPPPNEACTLLKRYYAQLHSLKNRFPQMAERSLFVFTWKDLYQNNVNEHSNLQYELAAVLFNIAASHTQMGSSVTRGDVEGMKLACTHFQCAAWAFGELKERYPSGSDFMTPELLVFMQQVCFAQAQECILEKSLIDNRKPNIVAKVTAQIAVYYGAALAALLTGGDDGNISQVIDSSVYKMWKKYVRFKISYLNCILYLYQGQHSEEQQKMGERVTLYQAAWEKLEDARKESKGLPDQKEISESLIFTADVVEAKRKNAKNENEFIYHEAIPELSSISAVQGANLVNGISFSVTDADVLGEDIFARLVPMKAHESSSMYSEEKAKLLRKYGTLIEEKDAELNGFMNSLSLDMLNVSGEKSNKIPQGIVDRCAALNANKSAIPDLISSMSQLAEICADVESNLKEISSMLAEEERQEREFEASCGVKRTPNPHITELTRELQKYTEAHARAGESNDTLRKAMELHVNNLKILARPLLEIQQSVPKLSSDINAQEILKDVKLIVNKVNEMKAQRAEFHANLRIEVNRDDITSKLIAHGSEEGLQSLFDAELEKHKLQTQLIDQNIMAQKNILQALTESYAKAAPVMKTIADVKHKRESFFSSLAASYDVYQDLLGKSAKGLEFYKKLSGNVQKLLSRFKSARDVQSEERQQRLKSVAQAPVPSSNSSYSTPSNMSKEVYNPHTNSASSATPKLRDYLKAKNTSAANIAAAAMSEQSAASTPYIPPIRPSPLGSENPTQAVCSGNYYPPSNSSVAPNEPPPPYSLQQTQYYDAAAAGYTNPMYQQQQQNVAPPAYKAQASPNSQFVSNNLSSNMSQMSLQNQNQTGNYNQGLQGTNAPVNINSSFPAGNNLTGYAATNPNQMYASGGSQNNQHGNVYGMNYSQNMSGGAVAPANNSSYQQPQQYTAPPPTVSAPNSIQNPYDYGNISAPTQPLYVATASNNSVASMTHQASPAAVPNNLQAPYVVNQMPQQTPTAQQTGQTIAAASLQAPYVVNSLTPTQQTSLQNTTPPHLQQYSVPPTEQLQSQFNLSNTKHPGYNFNQQTGTFEYASGYHQNNMATNSQFYGQYTSASAPMQNMGTTDSTSANKINVATGFSTPSPAPPAMPTTPTNPMQTSQQTPSNLSYYTAPYGYHSQENTLNTNINPQQNVYGTPATNISTYVQQMEGAHTPNAAFQQQSQSTYMQSGAASLANTQTTKSAAEYASSSLQQAVSQPKPKTSSNIDLLSDIDFSGDAAIPPPILPEPALKPQVVSSPAPSEVGDVLTQQELDLKKTKEDTTLSTLKPVEDLSNMATPLSPLDMTALNNSCSPFKSLPTTATARKISYDNISIASDLSSLDTNLDLDSISEYSTGAAVGADKATHYDHKHSTGFLLKPHDPFGDDKTLKYFHKEVERYEKLIESLKVKMLNGNTQLSAKWKELHDLLSKDAHKRSTTIAKLFPEKNRSIDCIPFDHARVRLERDTDDYINAAYVKNLGAGCPNMIIAQTPLQNSIHDFWSMIWSQKARTVLCLHTPNEMLDPFWPLQANAEAHYDDYAVKCTKLISLSHCSEYRLQLSMHASDAIIDLSVLQIKAWTKSSPSQIIGIARNALQAHQLNCLEFNLPQSPLIMNCLNGSERSELVAIAMCAILATQVTRPSLINVVDVWLRICSQRQNALRNIETLEQSMQIVLSHAHEVLNKRGIMTSYQMKTAPQVASKEKEESKDPLNELDPLWQLKSKN